MDADICTGREKQVVFGDYGVFISFLFFVCLLQTRVQLLLFHKQIGVEDGTALAGMQTQPGVCLPDSVRSPLDVFKAFLLPSLPASGVL